jgi:hypothetical protein
MKIMKRIVSAVLVMIAMAIGTVGYVIITAWMGGAA